jgi:hypothetical protein
MFTRLGAGIKMTWLAAYNLPVCLTLVQRELTATNASFRVSQFHEFGGPSNAIHRLRLGAL